MLRAAAGSTSSRPYMVTLSAGVGVKYIAVWVRDDAGNVSVLDEGGLVFVNRVDGAQALTDGQRVQYRGAGRRRVGGGRADDPRR
ncbi:MAG: hypothetical protein R2851_27845 [Caldilineaceae bacterium]